MKSEKRAERLRQEIAQSGRRSRQPFAVTLRRKLVAYAQQRKQEGATYAVIGGELGIVWTTIAEWVGRGPKKATAFRRIEVRAAMPTPNALVVVHASGTRVEGLDVAGIAELLRRLA